MNRFYSASSFFVLSKVKPVLFLVQLAPVRIYVRFVVSYWQRPVQNTNRCAFRPRFNRLGGGASPPVQKHDPLTVFRLHFNTDLGPNRPKTGLIISLRYSGQSTLKQRRIIIFLGLLEVVHNQLDAPCQMRIQHNGPLSLPPKFVVS